MIYFWLNRGKLIELGVSPYYVNISYVKLIDKGHPRALYETLEMPLGLGQRLESSKGNPKPPHNTENQNP